MAKTKDVSFSELDTIRQCLFKHQLGYRELWQPPETGRALVRGSLFHRVLECHYREATGIPWPSLEDDKEDLPRTIKECLWDTETGTQDENQEVVTWIWEGYQERYLDGQTSLDPEWEVLDVEFKVRDWLPTPRGTRSSFRLNGTLDLLVRDHSMGGGLWIVDHKTISRRDLSKSLEKDMDFDDQSGIYLHLLRRRGLDIRGVIFNHCRSDQLVRDMTIGERFRRTPVVRSNTELETLALEAYEQFRRAYSRSSLGDDERDDRAPRSPNPDTCRWRCPFTEPCLMSRKGTPIEGLLEELGYQKGEPRY